MQSPYKVSNIHLIVWIIKLLSFELYPRQYITETLTVPTKWINFQNGNNSLRQVFFKLTSDVPLMLTGWTLEIIHYAKSFSNWPLMCPRCSQAECSCVDDHLCLLNCRIYFTFSSIAWFHYNLKNTTCFGGGIFICTRLKLLFHKDI